MPTPSYKFATVIVGAGPAGLLFALVSRILLRQQKGEPSSWPILCIDRRTSYTRTHQLALDSKVYGFLQSKIADREFDSLIDFLQSWNFKVPVNTLENYLHDLLSNQGIAFKNLELQADNLDSILLQLPNFDPQDRNCWVSVIGADSVRSTVRDNFFHSNSVRKGAHQFLARLIIRSRDLPEHLNIIDNIKLSKFISSLVAYRHNPNGYAEMDLFLSEREFNEVNKLGANPKQIFKLKGKDLSHINAPLFNEFIGLAAEYTRSDPAAEISLQSVFKLEHSISENRVQVQSDRHRLFFLLGDSAMALPFQRGMSALLQSAYELAVINLNIYKTTQEHKEREIGDLANLYQGATDEILRKELTIVNARARLIRAITYFSRISAMVPFPMQSWLLSVNRENQKVSWKYFSAVDFLNLLLPLSSTVLLMIPIVFRPELGENIYQSVFVLAAFLVQFMGGVFYRLTLGLNRDHHWSKIFWRTQIIVWLVLGIGGSLRESLALGLLHGWSYATLWWVGGVVFALGLMLGDRIFRSGLKD